jgi:hypothetical protein
VSRAITPPDHRDLPQSIDASLILETRECQSEVIEPMRQRDAGNRDAERARVGEVGQAKTAILANSGDAAAKS